MYRYGGIDNVILTKDCMRCILNVLEEEYWYKLKLNKALCRTMFECHKDGTTQELAEHGHIESLNGRVVKLEHICRSGNLIIIKRFIGKTLDFDWSYGFKGACWSGNPKAVYYLIRIARRCGKIDWDTGLADAFYSGNQEILDLILKRTRIDNEQLFYAACRGGNFELTKKLFEQGHEYDDESYIMYLVGQSGSRQLIDYFIPVTSKYLDNCLQGAYLAGQTDMINYMIELGANNWNKALPRACENGNRIQIDNLIQCGANDWNRGLYGAIDGHNIDIIEYMIELGANDFNGALIHAIYTHNCDIVKLIIEKGVTNLNHALQASRNVNITNLLLSYCLPSDNNQSINKKNTDATNQSIEKKKYSGPYISKLWQLTIFN